MCKTEGCLKGLKLVKLTKIPCEDFLLMGLKYQHTDPPSPDVDYISIRLDLKDTRSSSLYRVNWTLRCCCLVTCIYNKCKKWKNQVQKVEEYIFIFKNIGITHMINTHDLTHFVS